ncbi:hypothetical protein EIP91_003360 [Steccherinum ochraceum]|uniref:Arrestin-like N-terminal domain-containing protein n=1 Tax=Steccherinum ochraceum TaxID=92696 RepID=A0A4R0RE50_9APHY|nr:hypothetical protein EIP91_003360 [Steccherinum ochraceum]
MVRSRAGSPSHLPSIFEGEDITGVVSLDLPREDSIKAITVTIVGQITTSATDVYPFLTLSQDLWKAETGHPHPQAGIVFNGKLSGQFQWPFNLAIPPTVDLVSASGMQETFRIPPSFSERLTRIHIQYQLIARFRRGKFRVDRDTVFSFTPFIYPEPFSQARQAAYRHNHPVPGPDLDPAGWIAMESIAVRGSIFNARAVDAVCTLSLAKPLMYTRGTVIPCSITIDCTDTQALDLLSMPQAVDVRLLRHISKAPADLSAGAAGPSTYGVEFEKTTVEIKTATWWPTSDIPHRRVLSGEIHLPKDLKPNCRVGKFNLYYTVEMFSLRAVTFSPYDTTTNALQVQPVDIATAYASGPRPRIYSPSPPPGYDDAGSTSRFSADSSSFRSPV